MSRIQNGERPSLQLRIWEKLISTCKIMKLDSYFTPLMKINMKWVKDLHVRPETKKLQEEKLGNAHRHWPWQWFFRCTKTTCNKSENKQVVFRETKNHTEESTEWKGNLGMGENNSKAWEINVQNI